MPPVQVRMQTYRKLDALRQTDKGVLPFDQVVDYLIEFHNKGTKPK